MNLYNNFTRNNIALLYGLAMLIGILLALGNFYALIFIATLLPTFKKNTIRCFLLLITIVISYLYASNTVQTSPSDNEIEGYAYITVESIHDNNSAFGKNWVYKGKIINFTENSKTIARSLPYIMYLKKNGERPPGNNKYVIEASISKTKGYYYRLKPKNSNWWAEHKSLSLTELRYRMKSNIAKFIHQNFKDKSTAKFLIGVSTGIYDDSYTFFQMSKLGLQHIMAISGFHFTIITLLLSLLIRSILPYNISNYILIGFLSAYFVFIGFSASIQRAWLSAIIVLISQLYGKPTQALNNLGIALIITLIVEPNICLNIGFQFSFLSTASIIAFYPYFESLLCKVSPKKSMKEISAYDYPNKLAFIFLNFFKKMTALSISVHVTTIPLMLLHFGKFPVMSLFANLFFPFIMGISIYLFIIIVPIKIILPWLGKFLFAQLEMYILFSLELIKNMPAQYNFNAYLTLHPLIFSLYMMTLFLIVIRLRKKTLEIELI